MPFRMRPTYIIDHVYDIDLDALKEEGIKGFLFDLDNTLMAPKSAEFSDDMKQWIEKVSSEFKIAVVSNNTNIEYMQQVDELLHCPVYHSAKKPRRGAAICALKEIDLLPSQVIMVGDRPLTDILVGQRLGMKTILVDPLIKHQEWPIVKFLRKLERIFIKSASREFSNKS